MLGPTRSENEFRKCTKIENVMIKWFIFLRIRPLFKVDDELFT